MLSPDLGVSKPSDIQQIMEEDEQITSLEYHGRLMNLWEYHSRLDTRWPVKSEIKPNTNSINPHTAIHEIGFFVATTTKCFCRCCTTATLANAPPLYLQALATPISSSQSLCSHCSHITIKPHTPHFSTQCRFEKNPDERIEV